MDIFCYRNVSFSNSSIIDDVFVFTNDFFDEEVVGTYSVKVKMVKGNVALGIVLSKALEEVSFIGVFKEGECEFVFFEVATLKEFIKGKTCCHGFKFFDGVIKGDVCWIGYR